MKPHPFSDRSSRRRFLQTGLFATLFASCSKASTNRTPSEIEGPFYPVTAQKDKDFDLTQIEGHAGSAAGKQIIIEGRVLDEQNSPIEDVSVEIWQANAAGRYAHPHDSNPAPLDPNFQGWALVLSGKEGGFRFKTILPGAYPAADDWDRPPHIHFKVAKRGYLILTTQMYFPGEKLNEIDYLLKRKSPEERKRMVATQPDPNVATYRYDINLAKL